MGASEFTSSATGKTAQEAFGKAIDEARYESGHGGYTGTIAEKSGFRMVVPKEGEDPGDCIDRCFRDESHFFQDKWGPAGCIDAGEGKEPGTRKFLFFGWASS